MSIPNHRDALFLRMAELLPTLDLYVFDGADEVELKAMHDGWEEIKAGVAEEVGAIHADMGRG